MAVVFGVISLPHGGPSDAWVEGEMLHLDRTRPVFRGFAILFFVGGAALAFFLLARLLGHWTWGVAGGLLWLAQPELTDLIQIRPDVLLAALALTTTVLGGVVGRTQVRHRARARGRDDRARDHGQAVGGRPALAARPREHRRLPGRRRRRAPEDERARLGLTPPRRDLALGRCLARLRAALQPPRTRAPSVEGAARRSSRRESWGGSATRAAAGSRARAAGSHAASSTRCTSASGPRSPSASRSPPLSSSATACGRSPRSSRR